MRLSPRERPPGGVHLRGGRSAPSGAQDPPHGRFADLVTEAGQLAVPSAVPAGRFSRASRSTRSQISWLVAGRPDVHQGVPLAQNLAGRGRSARSGATKYLASAFREWLAGQVWPVRLQVRLVDVAARRAARGGEGPGPPTCAVTVNGRASPAGGGRSVALLLINLAGSSRTPGRRCRGQGIKTSFPRTWPP